MEIAMKKALLIVAALATTWLAVQPAPAASSWDTAPGLIIAAASLQAQPSTPSQPSETTVDIKVEKDTHAWYTSPVWLAIGGLGLLLLIVLIILAARGGGGATVVSSK
jgi:hypothetical protein